jgi:hypothetical protein
VRTVEGLAQRHVDILAIVLADEHLVVRHVHVDAHAELPAVRHVAPMALDRDAAGGDARMQRVQLDRLLADAVLQCGRLREVAERHLQGDVHLCEVRCMAGTEFDFDQACAGVRLLA